MLNFLKALKKDNSGLALVEFSISLPFFMGLSIGGFETAYFSYVQMRLNQITVNTADSAARMGEGDVLAAKTIDEGQINDVFAGTIREGASILLGGEHEYKDPGTGDIALRGNALIILSSVEPVSVFDPDEPRYRIRWQRCVGQATHFSPQFGTTTTATNMIAIGPTGRQASPPDGSALMFVETHYFFKPLIVNGFTKLGEASITKTAAMVVRDAREYTGGDEGVLPDATVTPSSCPF
jgi:hypothetical protein